MYARALTRLNESESLPKQMFFLTLLSLIATAIIFGFTYLLDPGAVLNVNNSESIESAPWVVAIFVGPPIETFLFQTLLLLAVKRITDLRGHSENWFPAFLATTIAFATAHGVTEDSFYLAFVNSLMRVPLSIALALLAISQRSQAKGNPFLAVTLTHGFYNLWIFAVVVGGNLLLLA
jgi:hypothetical protein